MIIPTPSHFKNLYRLVFASLAFLSVSANGMVVFVDHSAIEGQQTGESWADAYVNLQTALTSAAPDDEIWVAQGTYYPDPERQSRRAAFGMRKGVAIFGGFAGGEGERSDRNSDPATNGMILSGDLLANDGEDPSTRVDNSCHVVVSTTGADESSILDGFRSRGFGIIR
jgi:hypothetical protein